MTPAPGRAVRQAPEDTALLAFPLPGPLPPAPRAGGRVLALRGATEADLPFLRGLYNALRAEEMAAAPWPPMVKQAFLGDQFRLQHHHFLTHSPKGDFLIVETDGAPIGRLYLDRAAHGWRVLDIGFPPEQRRRGFGAALIKWTLAWARRVGAGHVDLHVIRTNLQARALYERLGFRLVPPDDHPTHHRLIKPLSPAMPRR
jgi:RimJ/RimL family protein N-acetyltransferase